MSHEIPRVIHYCWFGGNPLPELAVKCIESWRIYFPGYEIKEWNESNFDLEKCNYVKEAYEAKKWAFVSDYARFEVLYKYGGLYFDTDVEVIKSIDDILAQGSFMGLENGYPECFAKTHLNNSSSNIKKEFVYDNSIQVNPGLGLAAVPGLQLYKDILDKYRLRHFRIDNGKLDFTTVVDFVTAILFEKGIVVKNGLGYCEEVALYPVDYFCPKNYITGEMKITENTRTIHHYTASWVTPTILKILQIENKYKNKYGKNLGKAVAKFLTAPLKLKNKFEQ